MRLCTLLEGWCENLPAELQGVVLQGLALDSRTVARGDAFIAVAGGTTHGIQHAREAQLRGAAVIIHDGLAPVPALDIPAIELAGLGGLLSALGSRFFHAPSERLLVAGITGTNGKTSTAHFIAQAWQRADGHAGLVGTLGYGPMHKLRSTSLTTPDAVTVQRMLAECIDEGVERVAMEVSSHALDQGRVTEVAFDAAVFTNLSRDHLDYHATMQDYAAAKRRLFTECRPAFAVINADDALGRALIDEIAGQCEVLSYGTSGSAELRASVLSLDAAGMQLSISGPWGGGQLRSGLLGRFNVANLLAAGGALALLGMPWSQVMHQLELMRPVPGRMNCLGGEAGQPVVIVDYAHTPDGLEQALQSLRAHLTGRLFCVFGCGGDRDRGKRPLMAAVAERLADRAYLTTDNPRRESPQAIFDDMLAGMKAPDRAIVIADRAAAIRRAVHDASEGDIVLVAGKGHEAYQESNGLKVPFSDEAAARAALGEAA